jgi:hypothetical protein
MLSQDIYPEDMYFTLEHFIQGHSIEGHVTPRSFYPKDIVLRGEYVPRGYFTQKIHYTKGFLKGIFYPEEILPRGHSIPKKFNP